MATLEISQGYICEFVDPVANEYYCKKCTLVARKPTISSCCGESFCHACIAGTMKQKLPCPACGKEELNSFEHVKYQQQINKLKVYCSMKGRGCCWLGILEQLDTHLDPEQDDCQYVDTRCPLNCQLTVPKNKVEHHMVEDCVKREHFCRYCSFKATYEEVVDKHLPECSYVPLQCPNMCGVTCERGFMEDHIKTCRLEEITCEFSDVGCKQSFIREKREEHVQDNTQQHLSLTASQAIATHQHQHMKLKEMKEMLEENMQGQYVVKEVEEKEEKMMEDMRDLRSVIGQQEKKLIGQKDQIKQNFISIVVLVIIIGLVLAYPLQNQNKDLSSLVQELQEGQKALSDKLADLSKQTTDFRKVIEEEQKERAQDTSALSDQLKDNLSSLVHELQEGQKALSDKLANLSKLTTDLSSLRKDLKEEQKERVHDSSVLSDQLGKVQDKNKNLSSLVQELKEGNKHTIQYLDAMTNRLILKTVRTFSIEQEKGSVSNSPFMYTHSCGYKFFLRIYNIESGQYGVDVALYATPGEFDDVLQWPARVTFTVELISAQGSIVTNSSHEIDWEKPEDDDDHLTFFRSVECGGFGFFSCYSTLQKFLLKDTLNFRVHVML